MGLIRYLSCLNFHFVFVVSFIKEIQLNEVSVVGGDKISIEEAPYMAALLVEKDGQFDFICGSSIITEKFVVTAAHCFVISAYKPNKILPGVEDLFEIVHSKVIGVKNMFAHPKFSAESGEYDVGLVKLVSPLVFEKKINKIELASKTFIVKTGDKLNAQGWGAMDNWEANETLSRVTIPYVDFEQCKKDYSDFNQKVYPETMMCAGEIGKDSCGGDSGGPLVLGNVQVGIVSWSVEECGALPGVYTKVAAVRGWIDQTVSDNMN